ncbi:MAG: hypothetical protein QMD36_01495 [Candidatus Aenigmarchaeota archaeon]|nr:hypothetical protein [Candidatus Aenigmarchaeota archaeon]
MKRIRELHQMQSIKSRKELSSMPSLPKPIAFRPNKIITKNILPTILLTSTIGVEGMRGKVIRSKARMNKIILNGKSIGIMPETAQRNITSATMLRFVKNISKPMSEMPKNIKKISAFMSFRGLWQREK